MAQRSDTPPSTTSLTNKQTGKTWKVSSKMETPVVKRPCKEHSFLTDVADVRAMEQGLVHLLEDFHSGKLQAFGADGMFDRMDQIREQQERLARLHFELDLQHHVHRLDSEDSRRAASENLSQLIGQIVRLEVWRSRDEICIRSYQRLATVFLAASHERSQKGNMTGWPVNGKI